MNRLSFSILRTRTRTRYSLSLPLPFSSDPRTSPPSLFALPLAFLPLLLLLLLSAPAHACSVCYGAQGDPQTAGMNGAILTLLGVTAIVATGLSLLFLRIMRRARHARTAYSRPPSTSADIVTGPVQS